ncbi:MAG: hypothetical protein HKN73_17800 [Gemmatimonadetes bacterium]|nr:hypothetical protein [Gemmatimonadota bacterium]
MANYTVFPPSSHLARAPIWVTGILLGLAVLTACTELPPTASTEDAQCGSTGALSPSRWSLQLEDLEITGSETAWVRSDGWIGLGPEDVDSLDAVAVVGMTIHGPQLGGGTCFAFVTDATVSTSRQAKGTAQEVDARLYEYVPTASPPRITIFYAGTEAIAGAVGIPLTRVIILPNEPPRYGETTGAMVTFHAYEP